MGVAKLLPATKEWQFGDKEVILKRWSLRKLIEVTKGIKEIYNKAMKELGDIDLLSPDSLINNLPRILEVGLEEILEFLHQIEGISKEELEENLTLNNIADYITTVYELNELGKTFQNLQKVTSLLVPTTPVVINQEQTQTTQTTSGQTL